MTAPLSHITALILAGGRGERLRSIVKDRPKPMAQVAGKPFLEILIRYLRDFHVRDIVLCTGYMGNVIKGYFKDGSKWDLHIRYSQEEKPLGTAGAVKHAESLIQSEPFLVLNGDSFLDADLESFLDFHMRSQAVISILLAQVGQQDDRFGAVVTNVQGRILSFNEKVPVQSGLVSAGIYLMNRSVLACIPSGQAVSLEHQVFPSFVNKGLYGMFCSGLFVDIGTPESYDKAQKLILERRKAKA